MARAFLSFSHADRETASRLADDLVKRGVDLWWDGKLTPGENWQATIQDNLAKAAAVVVLITPASVASKWVSSEWASALGRSQRIIPVLVGGGYDILPSGLRTIHAVDLSHAESPAALDAALDEIARAIGAAATSADPAPTSLVERDVIVDNVVNQVMQRLRMEKSPLRLSSETEEDEQLVFVITSFQPDMEPAFEAIEAAAIAVGLRAERVKDRKGDYRITDQIIDMIRRARLIVADLTHERPNVYFELGYARGLGKTVVTIMREGTVAHFDVRDWTYTTYMDSRPLERDLKERLAFELGR